MGIFENLPYANFHELNLDWIIKTLKLGVEYMEQVKAQVDAVNLDDATSALNLVIGKAEALDRRMDEWTAPPDYFEIVYPGPDDQEAAAIVIPEITGGMRVVNFKLPNDGLWLFTAQAVVSYAPTDHAPVTARGQVTARLLMHSTYDPDGTDYSGANRQTVPVSGGNAGIGLNMTLLTNGSKDMYVEFKIQRNLTAVTETDNIVLLRYQLRGVRLYPAEVSNIIE